MSKSTKRYLLWFILVGIVVFTGVYFIAFHYYSNDTSVSSAKKNKVPIIPEPAAKSTTNSTSVANTPAPSTNAQSTSNNKSTSAATTKTSTNTKQPATAAQPSLQPSRIEIDKSLKTLKLYINNKVVGEYKITILNPSNTPTGTFRITAKNTKSPTNIPTEKWIELKKVDNIKILDVHFGIQSSSSGKEVYPGCILLDSKDIADLYSKALLTMSVIVK